MSFSSIGDSAPQIWEATLGHLLLRVTRPNYDTWLRNTAGVRFEETTLVVNALAPAEVSKVVLDEDSNRIEVVVAESQLSLAIGRRGQNVRLASQLTGWDIDILTEQEESERRQKEFHERTQMFMECLDVDETIAQLLVTEGFGSVEELALTPRVVETRLARAHERLHFGMQHGREQHGDRLVFAFLQLG